MFDSLVRNGSNNNGIFDSLSDVTNYVEVVTNELQLAVMRARFVSIGKLFSKVPRLVRALSAEFKKQIDLKLEGESTELDRSLIPIVDPSKVFASPDSHIDEGYIVMCNIGEKIIGVKAYSVVGQEEVVMKLRGEFLGNINGVGGATIRGDGKVKLILDLPALIEYYGTQRRGLNPARAYNQSLMN